MFMDSRCRRQYVSRTSFRSISRRCRKARLSGAMFLRPLFIAAGGKSAGEHIPLSLKELGFRHAPPQGNNPFALRGFEVYEVDAVGCELQVWQRRFRHKAVES